MKRSAWFLSLLFMGLSGGLVSEAIAGPGSPFSPPKPPGMMGRAKTSDQCVLIPITIGETLQGNLDASCSLPPPKDYHVAYYVFDGLPGQGVTMTVTYSDPALTPVLVAFLNYHTGEVLAENSGESPVAVSFTVPTKDLYVLGVATFNAGIGGDFTISLESSAGGGCALDEATLCLAGRRFQVQADWDSGNGEAGLGHAVMLTDATGYFWFFDPTNVEAVVKVVAAAASTTSNGFLPGA